MHSSRSRERPEEGLEPTIGSYHELYFDDIADGVAYCQRIVPHVLPPFGSLNEGQPSRMAVWLHVPRRSALSERGCYLYMSQAVHEALERAGRAPRTTGTISRLALPNTAVLVFGDDRPEARAPLREERHSKRAQPLSRHPRLDRVIEEADASLR